MLQSSMGFSLVGPALLAPIQSSLTAIGAFLASADEAIMMSTFSSIASEFDRLSEGSWLLVAYNFAYCISLPVVSASSER